MTIGKKEGSSLSHYDARKLEERALIARREAKSGNEIGELYEKAGDLRLKEKDFAFAEDDYIKAQRFGYPYDSKKKKSIEEKIISLRLQKKRASEFEKGSDSVWKSYSYVILAITSLLAALGFVSMSLTGNVIGGLEQNDSKWMGLCFFICGLIFSFIYLKNKK